MSKKRILALVLVMVLVACYFTGCGGSETSGDVDGKEVIKLTIGSGHAREATQWTYGVSNYFQPKVAERVANETDYEIEWVEAWGGSIAGLGEELEAVEGGLLDIGCIILAFEPTKLMPHLMTYYMPFQSEDPVLVANSAMTLYEEFPIFKETYDQYNQKFLSVLVSDDYNLFSNYPIYTVDDLDGHKIAGSTANLYWIANTGAVGVQSSLVDGYTSMQTGVYEGFINPTIAQFNYKIHEVGPYLLLANFGVQQVANLTINMDTWNSLPKEVQDIMVEEGIKCTEFEAQYTADEFDSMLSQLEADGAAEITQLSQEEKIRWVNMIPNVVGEYYVGPLSDQGIDGAGIVERYYELLQEGGYQMIREWDLSQYK